MTAKKFKVGGKIESWCTKCKEDRRHAIETLKKDGNPWKVRCDTCDGSHLYRLPKGEKGKAAAAKKKRTTTSRKRKTTDTATLDAASAKPYAMDGEFQNGDVISHARFGLGQVSEIRPGGKMEVSFGDAARVLLCKAASAPIGRRRTASRAAVAAAAAAKAQPRPSDAAASGDSDATEEE